MLSNVSPTELNVIVGAIASILGVVFRHYDPLGWWAKVEADVQAVEKDVQAVQTSAASGNPFAQAIVSKIDELKTSHVVQQAEQFAADLAHKLAFGHPSPPAATVTPASPPAAK